jgi:hypothetical protein
LTDNRLTRSRRSARKGASSRYRPARVMQRFGKAVMIPIRALRQSRVVESPRPRTTLPVILGCLATRPLRSRGRLRRVRFRSGQSQRLSLTFTRAAIVFAGLVRLLGRPLPLTSASSRWRACWAFRPDWPGGSSMSRLCWVPSERGLELAQRYASLRHGPAFDATGRNAVLRIRSHASNAILNVCPYRVPWRSALWSWPPDYGAHTFHQLDRSKSFATEPSRPGFRLPP